ncbi:hypothetical protein MKSMC1_36950 [Mycobacterium kansasii]|uniref:Uncharacterized protein n=1 Tax=Mycobacterium kansasii TaxID=1768 RepID=A0A1V3WNJ4_MYCKA|nr:hypothetical protein MKSMC1_36950 [Mycobacterium kansasii]OOK68318.1 hypothetical protein BZL29_6786 [Mycobacterium kansasii]
MAGELGGHALLLESAGVLVGTRRWSVPLSCRTDVAGG